MVGLWGVRKRMVQVVVEPKQGEMQVHPAHPERHRHCQLEDLHCVGPVLKHVVLQDLVDCHHEALEHVPKLLSIDMCDLVHDLDDLGLDLFCSLYSSMLWLP